MKAKRFLALILALVMALSLVACGEAAKPLLRTATATATAIPASPR